MSSKHPIDSLFEKELKEHQIQPSKAVWEKVAAAQTSGGSKKEGFFILRAASVILIVGLTSFWFIGQNFQSTPAEPELDWNTSVVAGPDNNPEPKKSEPQKTTPTVQKTNKKSDPASQKVQKPVKAQSKARSAKVIPVLQHRISDPVLALNDLSPMDLNEDFEGVEVIDDPDVMKIRVSLPELKGDYESKQSTEKDLGKRMWAYASTQYERVLAGESIELPKTEETKIEIPLPDFINRRFSK